MDKLDLIKIKTFSSLKDTLEVGKKCLLMTYLTKDNYVEYINFIVKFNSEKKPIRKWAKGMNRYFAKVNIQMATGISKNTPYH